MENKFILNIFAIGIHIPKMKWRVDRTDKMQLRLKCSGKELYNFPWPNDKEVKYNTGVI